MPVFFIWFSKTKFYQVAIRMGPVNQSINQSIIFISVLGKVATSQKKKAQQLENAICKITEIVRAF